jgi:trehalose utilization protein
VLIWWGHKAHREVDDAIVERVKARVLGGMGWSSSIPATSPSIFKSLMGTTCDLKWREGGDKERLWVVAPGHPITEGIGEYIELEEEEMYGEHFDIPAPETLVFVSWFTGGEVFRSGVATVAATGKIFYFRPATRPCRPTITRRSSASSPMASAGPRRPTRSRGTSGNRQPLEAIGR